MNVMRSNVSGQESRGPEASGVNPRQRPPFPRSPGLALAFVGLLLLLGCGEPRKPTPPGSTTTLPISPMNLPGIQTPPVVAASKAGLPDDAPVVGVLVAGQARAYSLRALSRMDQHVVNDLVGSVPVSVTYCDTADCLRVFSVAQPGKAIELDLGGRYTDGLMLRYQGQRYDQKTGKALGQGEPLPLTAYPHERTTWKAWREKHPGTQVYVGEEGPIRFPGQGPSPTGDRK